MEKVRYFLSINGSPEEEVTKEQFIKAEREAGFHPKKGLEPPATDGFSYHDSGNRRSIVGSITYED